MTLLALNALSPVVLLIALGHALRRSGFLAETFWPQAEKLSYFVLLPCLFFHGMATAHLEQLPAGRLALVLLAATCGTAALVLLCRWLMRVDGPAFTSIFQGSIRFNNYIGLTMVAQLFGAAGVAYAAICNAAMVPTVNVLSVLVFAGFGAARMSPLQALKQSVSNPLTLSCLFGLGFHESGLSLPETLAAALKTLGSASLPLGLLCVGAALRFSGLLRWLKPIATASLFKLALIPILTFFAARLFGLPPAPTTVALIYQALPTASSAYILARQLGGDAPLMAAITAAQTLAALITLPLALGLLAP